MWLQIQKIAPEITQKFYTSGVLRKWRHCRLDTYGRRAFFIAGPTVWNSLPDELRDPTRGSDSFKQILKTTNVSSALEVS